ncbi:hypothetical protein ILUMI_10168, partial [Ignelater luminosus]
MAFTNEDHLNVHKKKHDMALHLGIDTQNNTVADQTPTPTRFIRNCEEVGLFQDLQNVNPFDETFRKAAELVKSGSLHIPESSSDDTLHTPHIFPYIEEKNQASKFSRNNSNEPEFTVTTIDEDFLRLSEKKELSLAEGSNDSEDIDRNSLLKQNDLIISSSNDNNTLISKDSLISNIAPTAIPVPSLYVNSDIPPVVVNNLSDIQIVSNNSKTVKEKSVYVNNVEKEITSSNEVIETVKSKLIEALNNRIKKEESESDDCDNMVIQEIENSALFGSKSNIRSKIVKTSPKKMVIKHSNKEKSPNKVVSVSTSSTSNTRTVFVTTNTQVKKIDSNKKPRVPVSQSRLERQRELNRAAQVRSRQKKKNTISQMEIDIAVLHKDKSELVVQNQNLKNEVLLLKTMLMYHKDCAVSKDPKIMEEINAAVKAIQEGQQRMLQKDQGAKKVVPIRPNSANVIALTPVPNPVFIQVPTPVAQSIKLPTTTSLGTPITLPCPSNVVSPTNSNNAAIQIATLPTLMPKSLKPT